MSMVNTNIFTALNTLGQNDTFAPVVLQIMGNVSLLPLGVDAYYLLEIWQCGPIIFILFRLYESFSFQPFSFFIDHIV